MDLVLKARGLDITDRIRRMAEQKLAKIGRLAPRVDRMEVEIIEERNPRIERSHRVEVTCNSGKRVFRAQGAGGDVDSALDQVIEHLERQIASYRGKLKNRRHGGQSARIT